MDKMVEQQKQHFEKISDKYFKARQGSNHLLYKEYMWRYFFAKVEKYMPSKEYKCLEPMCGYGEGYKIINNFSRFKTSSYKGFDYSEELVKIANKNNEKLNIVHGNVLNYADDEKYDLIILLGGLHHVYGNVDKAIKNINKLILPNGLFINFEPTHNNWFFQKVRERIYKKNKLFDNESEQGFKLKELNELFINNGYTKVKQIYPGLLGYVLYYNPDAFEKLNIGNKTILKTIFKLEKYFFSNFIGKYFSFATLTLWRKNEN